MRTIAIAVVVALLVGGGVGYAIGHSSAPEPSPAAITANLRKQLNPVRDGLALIPNEYAQAYRNQGAEAKGVQGALDRVEKQLVAAAPDLRALTPKGVEQLSLAFSALKKAVAGKAKPAEVRAACERVTGILVTLPGGG